MPPPKDHVRILLLADSHLGFDLPVRPRVQRRRRGHDFLANHDRALKPALAGQVDLVVHGGDLFHRSKAPTSLVFQAFRSLLEVAEAGVPVFLVPGNHERSRIPHAHLASHPNLHIFGRPETRVVKIRGKRVAVTGFPYERRQIRRRFQDVLAATDWNREPADVRLLCIHHCVEGATVGPRDYTFRNAEDVVRCADLPSGFAAVLSGHIHRHQVLCHDLQGRPLPTPVFYPGSVERTAFAEMGEEKGYMLIGIRTAKTGGRVMEDEFVRLPARPMLSRSLCPDGGTGGAWTGNALAARLQATVAGAPRDAVLRVKVEGKVPQGVRPLLKPARIRALTPREMNIEIIIAENGTNRRTDRRRQKAEPPRKASQQILALEG